MDSHMQSKTKKDEQISEHQVLQNLQRNPTFKIVLSSTSDLQKQTKLAYIYIFKKSCKDKSLQMDCEEHVKHVKQPMNLSKIKT